MAAIQYEQIIFQLTAAITANTLDIGVEVPPSYIYFSEFKATVCPDRSMVFESICSGFSTQTATPIAAP